MSSFLAKVLFGGRRPKMVNDGIVSGAASAAAPGSSKSANGLAVSGNAPPVTKVATAQLGIALPVPSQARYVTFRLISNVNPKPSLEALCHLAKSPQVVVGIGMSLLLALNVKEVPNMKESPVLHGKNGILIPSTPSALWLWIRGEDRGEVVLLSQELISALTEAFEVESIIDAFRYGIGRDLTGFEDGTMNPKNTKEEGNKMDDACFVKEGGRGMEGSSFVAVQQWVHNLKVFQAMVRLVARIIQTNLVLTRTLPIKTTSLGETRSPTRS